MIGGKAMQSAREWFDFISIIDRHKMMMEDLRYWFKLTNELSDDIRQDFDTIDRALNSIRQKMST
jgi:hypothetical protein